MNYLNTKDSYFSFQQASVSEVYVDKSLIDLAEAYPYLKGKKYA